MNYIGIDLGSHTLKLARVQAERRTPELLACSSNDPYLPLAVRLGANGSPIEAGTSPFFERHRDHNVVACFRDGLSDRELGHYVYCLDALGHHLEQHAPNALCAAVPDHWNSTAWLYARAQAQATWKPLFLVREWQAAGAMQGRVDSDHVVFISMGAGSTSVTLTERIESTWHKRGAALVNSVSGRQLKQRLVDQIDEEMVQAIRRKPTEDMQADYQLREAVDRLFWSLVHQESASVDLDLFGHRILRTMEPTELAALAAPVQQELSRRVRDLLSGHRVRFADFVVWGELAEIVPVKNWLKEFIRPEVSPNLLAMDAVATGAARLCLAAAEVELLSDTGRLSAVAHDGTFRERFSDFNADDEVFAILEQLPTELLQSGEMAHGTLRWINCPDAGSDSSKIIHRQVTLGRNPETGWVFSSDDFPEVSFEHCVVFRRSDDYMIKDLDSTNGTFVNDQRVTVQKLKPNDRIRLGLNGPEFCFETSGR